MGLLLALAGKSKKSLAKLRDTKISLPLSIYYICLLDGAEFKKFVLDWESSVLEEAI